MGEPNLSSLIDHCVQDTGMTKNEVMSICRTAPKRYKTYFIPKRNGGQRLICHPSSELKALQYAVLRHLLSQFPVHKSAMAYEKGTSIRRNASFHAHGRVILKMDFTNFFNSITPIMWSNFVSRSSVRISQVDLHFATYIMFYGDHTYIPRFLSIGAPTSPKLANILLHAFDSGMEVLCFGIGATYTRFADDITISTDGFLDVAKISIGVQSLLESEVYRGLHINHAKTHLFSKATTRRVTGVTISNSGSLSLGRERKRLISAMVHRDITVGFPANECSRLRGLLAFCADIEPGFILRLSTKYPDHGHLQRIRDGIL